MYMYKTFFHYYPLGDEEVKDVWAHAHIILDANVLLDLYRWSEASRDSFLNTLVSLDTRLWIPHQVAQEFHQNRIRSIIGQAKLYTPAISNLRGRLHDLDKPRSHPFLSEELRGKFESIVKEVIDEHEGSKKALLQTKENDKILESLTKLYEGRVGSSYGTDDLKKMYVEAEKRFKLRIPPGFKDIKKDIPYRYGDYILWRQILDFAKSKNKPVIFVTQDDKSDWWVKDDDGSIISCRPELRLEMFEYAKQKLMVLNSLQFIEQATKYLDASFSADLPDEIQRSIASVKEEKSPARTLIEQSTGPVNQTDAPDDGSAHIYLHTVHDTDCLTLSMNRHWLNEGERPEIILRNLVSYRTRVLSHIELAKEKVPHYTRTFQQELKALDDMIAEIAGIVTSKVAVNKHKDA